MSAQVMGKKEIADHVRKVHGIDLFPSDINEIHRILRKLSSKYLWSKHQQIDVLDLACTGDSRPRAFCRAIQLT